MKSTNLTKIPIILLSLACFAALGVYIFLWVMNGRLQSRVQTLQSEVAVETVREERADSTGHFADDIRDDGALVQSFFVGRDNEVVAIETLEGLANVTGATVDITQVDVQNQTADAPGTLIVNVSGNGSWKQISHLLALLESLPFHANIPYVSLTTSPSPENTTAVWALSVRLEIALAQ